MKRNAKKFCSLLLVFLLFMGATFPSGFSFGGMLEAFGAEYCGAFDGAEFNNGVFAYNKITWQYAEDEDIYVQPGYKPQKYEGIAIVDYHGDDVNLVIPEYIDGLPVISVSITCTQNKNKIESVTLPSTLKIINTRAFKGLVNLKTVIMGDGVEKIADDAFNGCYSLKNINLSKSIMRIGSNAFYRCTSLESVVLPEGLITLEYDVFNGCTSLTEVTFNDKLLRIGANAFFGCNLQSVELKENVIEIGNFAFSDNVNLKTITLPESLETIGGCFIRSTAIEEIEVPKNLTSAVGFLYGSKIKNLVLPSEFFPITQNIISSDIPIETLTLENTEIVELNLPKLKTLIYKGEGKIEKNAFYYDSATGSYRVPETVIFTDAINLNMHDFLLNTVKYYYSVDTETGYHYYNKEYSGEEEFRALGNSFVNGDYTYDLTADGGAVITDYNGAFVGAVTVLSVFEHEGKEYPVVAIGNNAFAETYATEYILPDTVKKIGDSAFYSCEYLTKASIPDGVTVIEPRAFADCGDLAEITIPQSVVFIDDYAFANDHALTEIVIPSSVGIIGSHAFYNNWSASTVTLNEGLEKIGSYAFANKQILVNKVDDAPAEYNLDLPSTLEEIGTYAFNYSGVSGEVVIPGGVTNVSERAFYYSKKLTSLVLSEGVEKIGEGAFSSTGITSVIIPSSVKELGKNAFSNTNLVSVTVPSNVKRISERCFSSCKNLKTVIIENGVEYIDYEAFYNLSAALETMVIPESVREIAPDAFKGIASVDNLYFNAACHEYDLRLYDDDIYSDTYLDPNYTVTINYSGRFADIFSEGTQINKLTVGESVKYFPTLLLWNASVGEVVLPDSVVAIGEFAFSGCTVGKPLALPESVESIYKYAFDSAVIPEITLPRNLEVVKEDAFYAAEIEKINYNCINCDFETNEKTEIEGIYESPFTHNGSLKTVVIGESVEKIPDFLFCTLPGLEDVYIPVGVTSLGKGAFAFSGVKSVTGLEGLEETEDYTFYGCQNLTEFDMSNLKVTDIGYYAFANSGLETVKGSDSLESVGEGCFEDCANLKNVNLGSKLMLIGANAFANCTSLTEITIPDSVKDIGAKAFYGDTALASVKMSDNVIYVPDECFSGCSALETFIWNPETKLIGRLAFTNCAALGEFDFVNLEKLYDNSFLNSGVTDVQLGEAEDDSVSELKEIETQSFMDCDNLSSVGVGGNVETIKTQAFADCENLETAFIADSVTEIAADAFDGCDKLIIYCTENSYAYSYAKEQGIPVSTLVIASVPNQIYTGSKIEPEISVSASGNNLEADVDFGVTYANNINVGNADVNVKGKGGFRMFASKANFTIVTKNIAEVTVAPVADQPYTGEAVTPKLTVTDGVKYLVEGKDYSVAYSENVEKGTATAKVNGIGNYSGFTTVSFVISEEVKEPTFFEKLITAIENFFAKIVAFLVRIFS